MAPVSQELEPPAIPGRFTYMARRITEGHSKLEVIRCLKRYIAREVFTLIGQRYKEINQARTARNSG